MAVVIETTLGDMTVDLFTEKRPRACLNFLKLCKMKYYNFNLFHTISRGFMAQTGDPTGSRNGGESIYGLLEGTSKRFFESEKNPRIKHTVQGLISFVGNEEVMIGSQFFITLGEELTYLDDKHCVFGEVMEGLDVLELLNETICDTDDRPYKDVRITHMVILEDPFNDLKLMRVPSRSPSPSAERLQGGRIGADEDIDDTEGKTAQEISEMLAEREAKARATILEMVGDLPDAEMAPPENVLFVCKLNPVTTDDDLEIIFSRFGKIKSCEVIRDKKSGDSLQYAFVEFEEQKSCEDAYFKMDNVLIDDRRIHVDFSQSVSKIKWHGKGRGVTTYDDKGRRAKDDKNDIGKGKYKRFDNNSNGRYKNNRDSPRRDYDKNNYYKEDKNKYSRDNDSYNRSYNNHARSNDRSKARNDYTSRRDEYSRKEEHYSRGRNDHSRRIDDSRQRNENSRRQDDNSRTDRYRREDNKYKNNSRSREYSDSIDRYTSSKHEYSKGDRNEKNIKKQKKGHNSDSDSSDDEDSRKKTNKDDKKKSKRRKHSMSSDEGSNSKKQRESIDEKESKKSSENKSNYKKQTDYTKIDQRKMTNKRRSDEEQPIKKKPQEDSDSSSSSDEGEKRKSKNAKKKKKKRKDSSSSEEEHVNHRKHKKTKRKRYDSDSS